MAKEWSGRVLMSVAVVAAIIGALIMWLVGSIPSATGQSFGSPAVGLIRDLAPLIQGFTTFLGAALGGVVAMLTTRQVISGTAKREREKIASDLAIKRGEILRTKAEEALALVQEVIDAGYAFSLHVAKVAKAKAQDEEPPPYPSRKHQSLIKAQVLIGFYFPHHAAAIAGVVGANQGLMEWQNKQLHQAFSNGVGWLETAQAQFLPVQAHHKEVMDRHLLALMVALQRDVNQTLPGL